MSESPHIDRVNAIFRVVFNDPEIEAHPEMVATDVPAWNSLRHMEMIAAVEKEFGIKFKLRDLRRLNNVGDMLNIIDARATT